MSLLLETAATLVCPIAAGALLGTAARAWRGERWRTVASLTALLAVPTILATAATIRFPVLGLWDGMVQGFLVGLGLVFAAHRAYADPRRVVLTATAAAMAGLLLEAFARVALPPPPVFSSAGGPHFLLAHALRTAAPDGAAFTTDRVPSFLAALALETDLAIPGEAKQPTERPPAPMMTSELVCSILYGPAYRGPLDVTREPRVVFPDRFTPRPGAARRILHVGDSMVFGANVPREHTFTAELGSLEPDVEHINGGISGMSPDGYFAVLRSWVARHCLDVAVMYLFEGNDLNGIDSPHPCTDWQPLLVYEDGTAHLRYPQAPVSQPGIGFRWLVMNSPPPFAVRALITGGSAAAGHVGAALVAWTTARVERRGPELGMRHLEAILRTARDELRAADVRFVVVVLPSTTSVTTPDPSRSFARQVLAMAERLDIPALDASEPMRAMLARGEDPTIDGSHFNHAGHRTVAEWLHARLAAAAGLDAASPSRCGDD